MENSKKITPRDCVWIIAREDNEGASLIETVTR